MKKFLCVFSLATAISLNANVLATVNGDQITDTNLAKSLGVADFKQLPENMKKGIVERLIDMKLIIQDAKKSGIENTPEFRAKLNDIKDKALIDAYQEKMFNAIKVSDAQAKKFYSDNKDKFKIPATVEARHILFSINDKKDAEATLKALQKLKGKALKDAFIKEAKAKSIDKGSAANGGELGYFQKTQMVPEFGDAAFSMKNGELSKALVKTQFGYHIILKENSKPAGTIPFDKIKSKIIEQLKVEKFKKEFTDKLDTIRKNAKIETKF